jgi:hypothetical protein
MDSSAPTPTPLSISVEDMLAHRDQITLCWVEPWTGLRSDGTYRDLPVEHRVTVRDAIDWQRAALHHSKPALVGTIDDSTFLHDFIVVNWAIPIRD